MKWTVPKIWKDGDVWILGGGSSITTEFEIPEKVVQDVLSGTAPISSYAEYLQPIYNKHVIGINIAFMIADWFDMIFVGDVSFFLKYERELFQYPKLVVSCAHNTVDKKWVKFLAQHPKTEGICTLPHCVSWNYNSGASAINLAYHTGAKRIFLLGFDMVNLNNSSHWHNQYKRKIVNGVMLPPAYAKQSQGFPAIAQDAKRLGVQIFNVSPKSKIKDFPKLTLKEALAL